MAVTHADLAIGRSRRALGSKYATCLMFFSTILGLLAFASGLLAEITRTEAFWITVRSDSDSRDVRMECTYTSSGRPALVSACASLLALAMAFGISQAYLWMALCNPPASDRYGPLTAWTLSDASYFKFLRWQAVSSFVFSWICFTVAMVLLVIGIVVEAGHAHPWSVMRNKCLVVRVGVFAASGVFGLFGTSLVVAFYVIALQTQRLQEEEANVRREVMEATMYYSSNSPSASMQELPSFSNDVEK
uniref:TSA: Wollemia nobilis Ref_Wollemi_Transcript_6299_1109 transcribed RNA sequence n=1 Tax=Wollemia nobilis TaxID=56998 RepID=A0A0C9S9T2_9CONI